MDQLDISIIQALQDDARKPYTDIAKNLGVAESTIRNRVSRLLADDTLRLRATFDYFKLGFNASAFVNITVQPGTIEAVAEQLKAIPEVSYLLAVTGDADLMVELTCRNQSHLMELITHQIRTISGITHTSTTMILKVYKELLPSLQTNGLDLKSVGDE
ncbi:MAG: Lrp/AsnC family transcriptional regulator [Chloroflexota bacterium]